MIRIKDIADRAGVSPTTVSNVIHGRTGRVSKDKVEQITKLIQEMNYVPSLSAQLLAKEHSGLIGVVIGYGQRGDVLALEDPFIAQLVGNLEYQIRKQDYYMMLVMRHEGQELLEQVIGWNFDGLIMMGVDEKEVRRIHALFGRPIVVIDCFFELPENVVKVGTNDRMGGYQMGSYLIRKGHRRALFLSDCDVYVDHERWLGFLDALREGGVADAQNRHLLICWDKKKREQQYREILPYLRSQSALFFSSDFYAVEASNFLQNQGVRVPQEISVAGFDDINYARMTRPALTTIRQNVDEKARYAVEAVTGMLRGRQVRKEYRISTSLVVRESVAALRCPQDREGAWARSSPQTHPV